MPIINYFFHLGDLLVGDLVGKQHPTRAKRDQSRGRGKRNVSPSNAENTTIGAWKKRSSARELEQNEWVQAELEK